MGKNSVRNLQYGPRTRLVRGIYILTLECNCRGRIEGLKTELEPDPTAGQRQTEVEELCCCPTCQWAQWAVSE